MRTGLGCVNRREDGQMALTMILTLLIVFMFFAVAFDAGVWYFDHRTAQNQTDAAAEAGVLELPDDETTAAVDIALEWLVRNKETGGSECTAENGGVLDRGVELWSSRPDGQYDRIRVCVSRDSRGFFGLLSGIDFATISGAATAGIQYLPAPYTLMAFNPDACSAIDVGGQGDTSLGDGRSYVESDCDTALTVRGQGHLDGAAHDVVGCGESQGANAELEGQLNCGSNDQDDPLADLDPPDAQNCDSQGPDLIISSGFSGDLPPGDVGPTEYCQFVSINGGDVTMPEGVYIFHYGFEIQGNNLSVTTRDLDSGGTLIYMTCPTVTVNDSEGTCDGQVPNRFRVAGGLDADITFNGNSAFDMVFVWVDRTAGPEPDGDPRVVFEGQKLPTVNGLVYAIASDVRVAGSNEPDFSQEPNMAIIGDTIDVEGQGDLTFTYVLEIENALLVYGLLQ